MSERAKPPRRVGHSKSDELVFMALGGLGEIGMNVYLYGFGPENARTWLMVDLGVKFPNEIEPGADVVLPDLRFIIADRKNLVGLVLTHAHEDHIGAVIDLWPSLECPIFATPFTAGMVKTKLGEYGRTQSLPIREVPLGGRFQVAPFDVEFVSLTHSIPEPAGSRYARPQVSSSIPAIGSSNLAPVVGRPPDEARLKALGDEGVLAMVGDSTNAMREGRSPSEADVGKSLTKIIAGAPRCVAVTGFASNVARLASIAEATRAAGRTLVVAGRALHRIIEVATETGYLPKNLRISTSSNFPIYRATRSWSCAPAAKARCARPSPALPPTSIPTFRSTKAIS